MTRGIIDNRKLDELQNIGELYTSFNGDAPTGNGDEAGRLLPLDWERDGRHKIVKNEGTRDFEVEEGDVVGVSGVIIGFMDRDSLHVSGLLVTSGYETVELSCDDA